MKKETTAKNYFINGFNCAQSVLITYKEDFHIHENDLLKISCGLGAGMGRLQEICGAVSGAYMVIGLKYGKCNKDDNEAQDKTYGLVREFESKFRKLNKSTKCIDLTGCSLLTDEGRKHYFDNNLREKVCEKCVEDAVKILNKIL